jgi:HEAT repeat protein
VSESVYQNALPEMHASFALLARMETTDVTERRRAASELAALAEKDPLGRLAVERLCRLVTPEADALVFQSVLAAVAQDESDAAHRIAYAAVGHAAAEVRRRGCLHLAAHPHPQHAPVLLPAVEDETESVAAAAVQALGACGHATDAGALTELMRVGNEPMQLEAALALVQLDDSSGIAALERLAYSRDAAVRRRVAEKMGELSDAAFTPTLIRLLDDRVSVMRAALAALPQTVGEDKSLSPDGTLPTTTERVRRWKAWFASR